MFKDLHLFKTNSLWPIYTVCLTITFGPGLPVGPLGPLEPLGPCEFNRDALDDKYWIL